MGTDYAKNWLEQYRADLEKRISDLKRAEERISKLSEGRKEKLENHTDGDTCDNRPGIHR